MKKIIFIIFVGCLIYFVVGGILSYGLNIIPKEKYLIFSGFVGGIASVISLISLSLPKFTTKDFEIITSDRIKNIETKNDELKLLIDQFETKKEQVEKLELLQKQLPLLVNRTIQICGIKE
jgi:hypothetical protein